MITASAKGGFAYGEKKPITAIPEMLFVDPYSEIYINIPNMSLAYAATIYNVNVCDQHVLPYPTDRFMKLKAKTLGISVRSFAYDEAQSVARKYSAKYPDAAVKSIDALDVQCCYPFLNFKEAISINREFSDELPFPKYELFDSFNYLSSNWRIGLWHYPLLTSLGCPYQCVFCASSGRTYKTRSVANCIAELKQAIERYGITSFEILDDVFNLDKARVMEFCEKAAPLKLRWLCSNGLRADRFDRDQAAALKAAGCLGLGFGIESVHDDILERIKKGETVMQIEAAVKTAKEYFEEVKGYFIVGLPGSTYQKDTESIEWAVRMRIKPVVSYYVPDKGIFYGSKALPGSDAYPGQDQRKVYAFSKKQVRNMYKRQRLPFRLIMMTLKALRLYNLNSLLTHFIIGPARFLNIVMKGEVQ